MVRCSCHEVVGSFSRKFGAFGLRGCRAKSGAARRAGTDLSIWTMMGPSGFQDQLYRDINEGSKYDRDYLTS
jgi:hypothetical protein